jgi:hypothetical protein
MQMIWLIEQFTLHAGVMVILQAVFVAHHLAIEFVHQFIDGGIQIFIRTLGKQVAAFDMDIALGALAALFFFLLLNGQQNAHINHLVEVPQNAV